VMSDLPSLSEIPNKARRKLMAALRGVPARGVSESELERRQEARDDEAEMLRYLAECNPIPKNYRRAVREWRELRSRLAFIRKLAALIEEQRREEELSRYFAVFAARDIPPRRIVDALGLRYRDVLWRLECAHDDIARKRQGLLTRRQIAARERARYFQEMQAELAKGSKAATP